MAQLPPRALEALRLIARNEGISRGSIASDMAISPRTASVYLNLLHHLDLAHASGTGRHVGWSATAEGLRLAGVKPKRTAIDKLRDERIGRTSRHLADVVEKEMVGRAMSGAEKLELVPIEGPAQSDGGATQAWIDRETRERNERLHNAFVPPVVPDAVAPAMPEPPKSPEPKGLWAWTAKMLGGGR